MKKATKKQVLEMAIEYQQKYEELVWYARSGRNIDIPTVMNHRDKIEGMYPKDTQDLSGESGDFLHGFNSGMLAGMRLITSMMMIDIEEAIEMFPELDT
jgi:hypothetical protein